MKVIKRNPYGNPGNSISMVITPFFFGLLVMSGSMPMLTLKEGMMWVWPVVVVVLFIVWLIMNFKIVGKNEK